MPALYPHLKRLSRGRQTAPAGSAAAQDNRNHYQPLQQLGWASLHTSADTAIESWQITPEGLQALRDHERGLVCES